MDLKYFLSPIVLFALSVSCFADPRDICPPEDIISPCFCVPHFEDNRAMVRCEKITENNAVMDVLNKTSEYGYEYFLIDMSSLTYVPAEAFNIKRIRRFFIFSSTMVTLFNEAPKTKDLETLTLYELKLSRAIQWDLFTGMPNLKSLSIEHSPLKSIDASFVQYAPKSLEIIQITNCSITKVADKAFEGMPNLIEISLEQGTIKEFNRSMLPNPADKLKKISLRHNRIEVIPEDLFTNMRLLQDIWLTGNLISAIPENTYKIPFLTIRSLTLDENPIKCNCELKWVITAEKSTTLKRNLLGVCEEPKNLHGSWIMDLTLGHFAHCDNN